jgi:uncharacterized membrane protein (UPF0127 family)
MRRGTLLDQDGRAWDVVIPETGHERRRGLLGRRSIGQGAAMLFERCRSIHTFGMRFPITVVLLDGHLRVVEVRPLSPGRILLPRPRVRHVLECTTGTEIRAGDRMELVLGGDQRPEDAAEDPCEEDADDRGRHEHERDRPADRAREGEGLATSRRRSETEDLKQGPHTRHSAPKETP